MSNDYNHKGRGRGVGGYRTGRTVLLPPPPCRIPQRVSNYDHNIKPKGLHSHPKSAETTRHSPGIRPQSVESRKSSDRHDGSIGGRALYPKPMPRKSTPKIPKKAITVPEDVPDQETIRKREELELQGNGAPGENLESSCDVWKMKTNWQEKIIRFEKLKCDLGQLQRNIMQVYISLKNNYKMMISLGQTVQMPPVDELYIMNVAKLEPDQLLQLCTIGKSPEEASSWSVTVNALNIDINRLSSLPEKLMNISELILTKRKKIIDWFDVIKTEERGIPMSKLTKKINEFNAENEMLNSSLQTCKSRFLEEIQEFVDNLRRGMNEVLSLQLRTEDLMYKLSQLSAENIELRKQLHTNKNFKLMNNKVKIDELEKELKEEKAKSTLLKDRLWRADGQAKIAHERAAQLEAALESAHSQNWNLECTVKKLSDENKKLQMDFEVELSKLTESIQENTVHLEEIAEARENLRIEKEGLQKRLDVISENNSTVFQNLQKELEEKISDLATAEQHLMRVNEANTSLKVKVEALSKELVDTEQGRSDLVQLVQEKDEQISTLLTTETELKNRKGELEIAHNEITQLKETVLKQSKTIEEIEQNFKTMASIEKTLQSDLLHRENYIADLQNNVTVSKKELYESHCKIQDHEQTIQTLKAEIENIHKDLGEYKDIKELRELIKQQQNSLVAMTKQNSELAETLQQKEAYLERHIEHVNQQDTVIEQKNAFIKMLSEKEKEQGNILKLLQNNLELRAQAETELSQQIAEKDTEVSSLVNNLDSRKQQISQLEKIILTLEDQLRKVYAQRTKDQQKIVALEKSLNENYQVKTKHSVDVPAENLDNLIKILEEELGAAEPIQKKERSYIDRKGFGIECPADDIFLKEKYPKSFNIQDTIERKKAMVQMETQKFPTRLEQVYNISEDKTNGNVSSYTSDMPMLQMLNSQRVDKKRKMFKFAGHKF